MFILFMLQSICEIFRETCTCKMCGLCVWGGWGASTVCMYLALKYMYYAMQSTKLIDESHFLPIFIAVVLQWNPSKTDTIGTNDFVHCSEVSLAKGLVIDHAPPTIAANYDKARLWTTKKTALMRGLPTDSF